MTLSAHLWNKVRRIQIRTSRAVTDAFAGAYHSAFKGRGMQFEDVREYQPGDDIRTIDWNVTARMHLPHVKNFREERELTVILAIDVSRSSLFGSVGQKKQEILAEIGAVLALSAHRNSDKIGLLLFTDQIESYIPPKKGMGHILRVIHTLLGAKPRGTGTDIAQALEYLGRVQRRAGVCFLISDFIGPPCTKELALAAHRYDLNVLCLTDPTEIDLPDVGLLLVEDLETGSRGLVDTSEPRVRTQLKNRALSRIATTKTRVVSSGATFVDLRTHDDYVARLQSAFAAKQKRRR